MTEKTVGNRIGVVLEQGGMLIVLAGLLIVCSLTVPHFFNATNLDALLYAVATVGMISCTMLFCLASGNFDLSVGTVVPAAGVVAAVVMNATGSITLGILAGLGLGACVGMVNGVTVAKAKINPLITTLATMQIVRGVGYLLSGSNGSSVGIKSKAFYSLGKWAFPVIKDATGNKVIFQITSQVWICLACFAIFGFLLRRTTFGRNTLAIGGNEEAARLAGIRVDRVKIIIFVLQGLIAALAGIILASKFTMGDPKGEEGLELRVISACVLGGVSLTGGVGKMSFVIAGVFIMGVVQNAMSLLVISSFWQYVVSGSILLAAVLFDRFKQGWATT